MNFIVQLSEANLTDLKDVTTCAMFRKYILCSRFFCFFDNFKFQV